MKTTVISFISIIMILSNLYSQGIPYGQEFQVNTDTLYLNYSPSISCLKDGGIVICWESEQSYSDSIDYYILCQIFDSFGTKRDSTIKVNTRTKIPLSNSSVSALQDGGFVVCWENHESEYVFNIFCRIFDATGDVRSSELRVNEYATAFPGNSSVLALKDSGFVICWHHEQQGDSQRVFYIFGQMFNASGSKRGTKFQVNNFIENYQDHLSLARLQNGGFVVCWESYRTEGLGSWQDDIMGQIFNASGIKTGDSFKINTYVEGPQVEPSVTGLASGGFVACWTSQERNGYDYDICGQLFDMSGNKAGDEFILNSNKYSSYQGEPSIAGLPDGGFVACWRGLGQNNDDVFGQLFDVSGFKMGVEFQVNRFTQESDGGPSTIALKDSGFAVCWVNTSMKGVNIFCKFFPMPRIHPLREFSLSEPPNDVTLNITIPTFRWQQPSSIREFYPWELAFDLYIDTDINFSNPKIIRDIQDTTYTIDSLAAGKTYFWKVLAKNLAGDSLWSTQQDWGFFIKPGATWVENAKNEKPQQFELFQNYPNPFNSSTTIKYQLPQATDVKLGIYNLLGQRIRTLVDQFQIPGSFTIRWDGIDDFNQPVASGIYLYQLKTKSFIKMNKLIVLR